MMIKGVANIDNESLPCKGEIKIHWIKEPQAYVTWTLFAGTNLLASKSENYFYDKNVDTQESLVGKIIKKIENYRIGRKKIFENIELFHGE